MKFYKAFEYLLCVVLEQVAKSRYLVQKQGSESTGLLICGQRALSKGEVVLCQVEDSDETGDHMVLCVMDYDLFDRVRNEPMSTEGLKKLNEQCDIDMKDFRDELDRNCKSRE